MKLIHKLFPAGHFVISLLFVAAALALIAIAGMQLWQGIQLFGNADVVQRFASPTPPVSPRSSWDRLSWRRKCSAMRR